MMEIDLLLNKKKLTDYKFQSGPTESGTSRIGLFRNSFSISVSVDLYQVSIMLLKLKGYNG